MNFNQYIGIPFVDQGRDRKKGVDCWGLVYIVYRDLGIDLPRYEGWYVDTKELIELNAVVNNEKTNWQKVTTPAVMDLVLLQIPHREIGLIPTHVGIVTDNVGQMIHAERGSESCLERFDGPRWARRIEGFYRYG